MVEWDLNKAIAMWNEGATSYTIARHFGKTRNSIIGHIKRARDKGLLVAKKAPHKPKSKPKPAKTKLPADKPRSLKIVEKTRMEVTRPSTKGLRIWELGLNQCRYPTHTTEDDKHYFCGEHTDKVYCETHAKLCYNRDVSKPKPKFTINLDLKRKFMHYR